MITTNDKALYEKLKMLRTHGITKDKELLIENHGGWYYEMQELGYNYRLTDIQAALGISQLASADERLRRRREIARKYDEAFSNLPIKTFPAGKCTAHGYHLYIIHTKKRKELYDYLRSKQIFCQVHYIPVHLQPFYRNKGFKKGMYTNVETYYDGCLSIPMYPSLTDSEINYVINTIKSYDFE
jgi:dTDP-4-amino-4,6-dideoxygalactose transaminase